jgi:hypothetical protein
MSNLNRRSITRQRSLLPVKVRIPGSGSWVESTVFDLNKTGACFLSDIPCSPGEKLEFTKFNAKEIIPAQVVWCQPFKSFIKSGQGYKVGIEYSFNNIRPT